MRPCECSAGAAVVAPSFFTAAFLAIMTAVPLGSSSAPPRANGGRRSAPHAQASRNKLTRMDERARRAPRRTCTGGCSGTTLDSS